MPDRRLDDATNARVRIRLTVRDTAEESGSWTREVPSHSFETTERGVVLGSLVIPWHRVEEYRQIVLDDSSRELADDGTGMQMRVLIDDGSKEGATYMVAADHFAAEPWTVALLLDRSIDRATGMSAIEKLFVPWHRVLEYERVLPVPEIDVPSRPDAAEVTQQA
jgi:hypothetical protein